MLQLGEIQELSKISTNIANILGWVSIHALKNRTIRHRSGIHGMCENVRENLTHISANIKLGVAVAERIWLIMIINYLTKQELKYIFCMIHSSKSWTSIEVQTLNLSTIIKCRFNNSSDPLWYPSTRDFGII